ncbi:hypothetical protein [Nitrososphaera viennensis]|uniref:Uncharacterized protein n=1 Tax=Nitrososphaera viennensis TaxID=1034015 RepID=A0A977IE06_9ARCH|nr:hypothetical protein [Nitrososphaera viennensis]UVS69301.1 hypothetical protein NWT39_00590 [Nitrososphaera viennensis]
MPDETELQKIVPLVPEHLRGDILPVMAAYPDDNLVPMLAGRTTFETHSDVVAHYMGDEPSDKGFELAKERWIKGLNECLQQHIKKTEVRLVVINGQSPDPLPFYVANILGALGVDTIRIFMAYNRLIGDAMLPTIRELPAFNSTLNLLSPETFVLLMCHFFIHPSVYPDNQHPALNVSGITTKVLSLGMSEYMPPQRGTNRSFEGIKKSLKNVSFDMEREGLLKRVVSSDHNFRLTPLGHLYARVTFGMRKRIGEVLSQEQQEEAALIQILQNFEELSRKLAVT